MESKVSMAESKVRDKSGEATLASGNKKEMGMEGKVTWQTKQGIDRGNLGSKEGARFRVRYAIGIGV